MRELQLLDEGGINTVFGAIAGLASHCRFRDCRHDTEPGCAVKEAVKSGALDAARLEHHKFLCYTSSCGLLGGSTHDC